MNQDALAYLDARLCRFQNALPSITRTSASITIHAVTDCAMLRLHAPYSRLSDDARSRSLVAGARIGAAIPDAPAIGGPYLPDPILGVCSSLPSFSESAHLFMPSKQPIYATVCSFYMHEMSGLYEQSVAGNQRSRTAYAALEAKLSDMINGMVALAPASPIIGSVSYNLISYSKSHL